MGEVIITADCADCSIGLLLWGGGGGMRVRGGVMTEWCINALILLLRS